MKGFWQDFFFEKNKNHIKLYLSRWEFWQYLKRQKLQTQPPEVFDKKDVLKNLKELRNRFSRIIRLWSLFCSIRIYASLHFLLIRLENYFFSFCAFDLFCLLCVEFDVIFITFAQSLFGQVICVFVLAYEKQFVNVVKVWVQFLIKNVPLEGFWTFKF